MPFSTLGLSETLLSTIAEIGYATPTAIQKKAIPAILSGKDVMAAAQTGTGKTASFTLPLLQRLNSGGKVKSNHIRALVLTPTRELAIQVAESVALYGKHFSVKSCVVYGGVKINPQMMKLRGGVDILVATPGRLLDLFSRNAVQFSQLETLVLDEADRMLDMGFMPDIEFLMLQAMKNISPRLMLFSATMLEQVKSLAKRFTHGKNIIEIDVSKDSLTVGNCHQYYYMFDDKRDKYYHFVRIIRKERPKHCMIFVNTKRTGDWLFGRLIDEKNINLKPELISGNLTQRKREVVLEKFRKRKINCLIATDVAARGLDIERVSHVFNYDLPDFEENYVHRIGRTARVTGKGGKIEKGIAISLVQSDQYRTLARIEGFMDKEIQKRPLPKRQKNGNWNRGPEK
ncbi:MAG: DEAD/DEAH box helicase, partial [Desulfuromonadales bacterium]|nr:DEAD/DEAH box helicase [Desulfuromonadales bacterium]